MSDPNIALIILAPLTKCHPEWFPAIRDIFLHDPEHPEIEDSVIVQCRLNNRPGYEEHHKLILTHPQYQEHYEVDEDNIAYVLTLPNEYKEDVKHIVNGDMDKISKGFQDACIKIYEEQPQLQVMMTQIFAQSVDQNSAT